MLPQSASSSFLCDLRSRIAAATRDEDDDIKCTLS
jgi:hypothetical protein